MIICPCGVAVTEYGARLIPPTKTRPPHHRQRDVRARRHRKPHRATTATTTTTTPVGPLPRDPVPYHQRRGVKVAVRRARRAQGARVAARGRPQPPAAGGAVVSPAARSTPRGVAAAPSAREAHRRRLRLLDGRWRLHGTRRASSRHHGGIFFKTQLPSFGILIQDP